MPKCQSCSADVLRTDAFCGTCGEPVPGGKPVVPLARESNPSGVQNTPNLPSGTFPQPAPGAAQAVAVVALSDPDVEQRDTGLTRTTVREREQSEPAPVLPLHRKKSGDPDGSTEQPLEEPQPSAPRASGPDRDTSLPNIPAPPGPPILASDLLRDQMRPATPGKQALRRVTVALSAVGAIGVLVAGGMHPLTLVSIALLIGILTLTLTPMSYRGRAISLFLMGAVAVGVALWQQTLKGIAPEAIILAGATILLGGSLLFRAYYRDTRLARIAVSCGVIALGVWFFASGGHQSLVRLDGYWQSWAPASTHMAFGLLALLSLLAFMDGSTRGGSHWWASALLTLYAVHIGLLVASELWPVPGIHAGIEGPTVAAIITGVVGTIVASMALAQVLVVAYNAISSRNKG